MNSEKCPFCLAERDDKAEVTLTMSRTYITCGHCGGGADPKFWQPSYLVRVLPPATMEMQ